MNEQVKAVDAFHAKMDVMRSATWRPYPNLAVKEAAQACKKASQDLEQGDLSDARVLRPHLILEELAEFLNARTEVEAIDGFGDLLYVLLGTAAIHDWPVKEIFDEIHRSNMTKQRASDDAGRVRAKGEGFEPPNLAAVLNRHKSGVHQTRLPLTLEERAKIARAKDE